MRWAPREGVPYDVAEARDYFFTRRTILPFAPSVNT